MYKNSRVLITGGTGSLGQELVRQLADFDCKEIIVFSRNEVAQVEMKRKYPNVTFVIGDIRDKSAIKRVCVDVDVVFHLAAIKHVPICEKQPMEAVKTNIIVVNNVVNACKGKLISMSTDKAVNPSCVYGYTKSIGESIVLAYPKGINIRSGNIWGSSGSVVPLFINQVKLKNTITLTNGDMTRFFIAVNDLVSFMLNAGECYKTGTYFPTGMYSFKMRDVAEVIAEKYGDTTTTITEIGARAGEKMHESLDGITYSNECVSNKKHISELTNV